MAQEQVNKSDTKEQQTKTANNIVSESSSAKAEKLQEKRALNPDRVTVYQPG